MMQEREVCFSPSIFIDVDLVMPPLHFWDKPMWSDVIFKKYIARFNRHILERSLHQYNEGDWLTIFLFLFLCDFRI